MAIRSKKYKWTLINTQWLDQKNGVKLIAKKQKFQNHSSIIRISSIFSIPFHVIKSAMESFTFRENEEINSFIIDKNINYKTFQTYNCLKINWPFVGDRDYIIKHDWTEVVQKPSEFVMLKSQSINNEEFPENRGVVRGEIQRFDFVLRKINEEKTKVYLDVQIDNKGFLPSIFSDRIQKKMAVDTLRDIYKKALIIREGE